MSKRNPEAGTELRSNNSELAHALGQGRRGQMPESTQKRTAEIEEGMDKRRAERKRKAGVAAELATAGKSLPEQLAAVKKAIRTTR